MLRFTDLTISPPGGRFPYTQQENGFKFSELDFEALLRVVKEHRKANNIPISGNYRAEIEDACCREILEHYANYEGVVTEDGRRAFPERGGLTLDDVKNFLSFVSKWISSGGKFVEQQEADRRALICLQCPKRTDLAVCWSCRGVTALIDSLKGNRHAAEEGKLKICGACKCDLKTKVWVDKEPMKRDDVQWWNKCWMRD